MITPQDKAEAEAFINSVDDIDARMWLDSIPNPHEFRARYIDMQQRIVRLEAKITNTKQLLSTTKASMGGLARISFQKHIDAALKELA